MTQDFILNPQLQQDCIRLGELTSGLVLLMNNQHFPWIILVPFTEHTELHQLERHTQQALMDDISQIGEWLQTNFRTDKINTAAIGNIVSQLHVHVIGRYKTDPCWPGVVWGNAPAAPYSEQQLADIRAKTASLFRPAGE